jgi:glycosyltransferase involved in cell wall biosynthesis
MQGKQINQHRMIPKKAIIVLGMHRSGTSVLTRIFNFLGASVSTNLMPATEENPSGYWESIQIAKFNNKLLQSAGTSWKSDAPVTEEWFNHPDRIHDRTNAKMIIQSEFASEEIFVLKCPRLCLLLPFWKTVFKEMGIEVFVTIVLRDPLQVAKSLSARDKFPGMKSASISNFNTSALVWLRYVLDAERYSRDLPRIIVDYSTLITDWQSALKPVLTGFIPSFPTIYPIPIAQINALLDPSMRRKKPENEIVSLDSQPDPLLKALSILKNALILNKSSDQPYYDHIFNEFERLRIAYEKLRIKRFESEDTDIWAKEILKCLTILKQPSIWLSDAPPTILFISNVPSANIGQTFRVRHNAEALEKLGWKSYYFQPQSNETSHILEICDMVVVFRTEWDLTLDSISKTCHNRNIPLVYDVDDIIFEPEVTIPELFTILNILPEADKTKWIRKSERQKLTLINSDAAILSTKPLAIAAARYCKNTFVLPNCLNKTMLDLADIAKKRKKPSSEDGLYRIGFAGGTETHQENFRIIEYALSIVLSQNPLVRLVIVGPLDVSKYSLLAPYNSQIEIRPKIPMSELFNEIHRFDINLAPLEVNNPFCETKSELRYLFAAAVSVPTIASPTFPLKQAIVDKHSGYLANNEQQWIENISMLLHNADIRSVCGQTARIHAIAQFGPEALLTKVNEVYSQILTISK